MSTACIKVFVGAICIILSTAIAGARDESPGFRFDEGQEELTAGLSLQPNTGRAGAGSH